MKKKYLELINEVAKIDKKAALYLVEMACFTKKDKRTVMFEYDGMLGSVMDWSSTKQGHEYWDRISGRLPREIQ